MKVTFLAAALQCLALLGINITPSSAKMVQFQVESDGDVNLVPLSQNSTLTQDGHQLVENVFNDNRIQTRQLQSLFQVDNPHDPSSRIIKNNVQWKDQNGDLLNIGRGGKIKKIGDFSYWIGHEPAPGPNLQENGGDIYLYKSSNLGSNSWELVRKIHEFDEGEDWTGNCDLHQHPDYVNKYFLICKKLFFMETIDEKPIEEAEFVRVAKPSDPVAADFSGYNFGNSEAFYDGQHMYYITSRMFMGRPKSRKVFIYRMDSTWKKLEELYTSFNWGHNKEGMHMVRNGDFYYLFASRTDGWENSRTYYKKSKSIKGLADASGKKVIFHPMNSRGIRSLGSQHRMIFEIEEGRWLFSGNRYPNESPIDWDLRFGRAVQAPVRFTSNSVEVYFKREFDWKTYDYTSGDYDTHPRRKKVGYKSLFQNKVSVGDISSFTHGGKAEIKNCATTGTKMLKKLFGDGYATYTINVDCSGKYSLHVSYLAASNRYLYVTVNGKNSVAFKFGQTDKNCASSLVRTIQLDLTQGVNVIKFQNPPKAVAGKSPWIEWVSLVPLSCS